MSRRDRERWSPAGVCVVILTIAVATVIVVGVIDVSNDNPASAEAARWLAGITGACLGCIATYVGVHSPWQHTHTTRGDYGMRSRRDGDDESTQGSPSTGDEPQGNEARQGNDPNLQGDESDEGTEATSQNNPTDEENRRADTDAYPAGDEDGDDGEDAGTE